MANSIGSSKIFTPRPPAKGSFPLDHDGECKELMSKYMKCLNKTNSDASSCQPFAKDYLKCRMDNDLMAKEDFKYLGFKDQSNINDKLLTICREDFALQNVVPLLQSCSGSCDTEISQYLDSKVDHHHGRAYQLTIKCFDGRTYEVNVRPDSTIRQLKLAIERSIDFQIRMKKPLGNKMRQIQWKHIWRKHDLWLDRTHRIRLGLNNQNMDKPVGMVDLNGKLTDTAVHNRSILEFIPRSTK
ncbi:hypothetical protein RDWZM_005582 [Blomia tropicalis]|uniref:Uncharacterized protein n=1 Tax=Blomia tropicalis TaxID=40697 RepID=A0A9Q0M9S7_BLOTA|nr:hypothetical protein RDWZM_005582 [Blomia tropicalis]